MVHLHILRLVTTPILDGDPAGIQKGPAMLANGVMWTYKGFEDSY